MKDARGFRIALGVGALAALALQLAALGPWQGALWGFHVAAFLPRGLAIAGWIATLFVVLGLLFPARLAARIPAPESDRPIGPTAVVLPVLLAVCAASFWLLRSQQTVLGDAWPLVTELPHGLAFHPRQPLSLALQQWFYRHAGGWFGAPAADGVTVAMHTVAFANVLAGVLFAATAWWLGRALARAGDRATASRTALLFTLLLLAQGYASLFFGYLETYAWDALGFALYLLAGLAFLRGRAPLAVPIVAFLFAVALHLSAIALVPSLLLLIAAGVLTPATRRRALRDICIGIAALVLLDRAFAAASPGYSLWKGVTGILSTATSDQGSGAGLGYLLSARHIADFLNAQHLIGPLAAGAFVVALAIVGRRRALRSWPLAFLVVAAATLLAASFATSDPALGYARDWDLFAAAGVFYTSAALALFARAVPETRLRVPLLVAALALSMLHLGSWVLLDHSEARSMRRFATLRLGQGRTEVVLGNWHYRNGRTAEAVEWFEKALRAYPRNANAWAFLGQIEAQSDSMRRAAVSFAHATALRPDKTLYRHNLVKALEAQGRDAETLPHYETLCRSEPDYADNWVGLGRALRAAGRDPEATAALQAALGRFEARRRQVPAEPQAAVDVACILAGLGRTDEALQTLQPVLHTQPDSEAALYQCGSILMEAGRVTEARPYLARLLQVNPQHPARDQVRVWLALSDAPR